MKITEADVQHIARLSRLEFSAADTAAMRSHLETVLQHFEQLDSVDTSQVAPTAHISDAVNVLRDDVVIEPMPREQLLANAPDTDGEAYIVPKVLE